MKREPVSFSQEVAGDDQSLIRASRIAEAILNTKKFHKVLDESHYYFIKPELFGQMISEIQIKFKEQSRDMFAANDRSIWAKDISINMIFNKIISKLRKSLGYLKNYSEKEVDQLLENSEEYKIIIVSLGFLIIHEIGHLIQRWNCITQSPDSIEAGFDLEKELFGGIVLILMDKPYAFNQKTKIRGNLPFDCLI